MHMQEVVVKLPTSLLEEVDGLVEASQCSLDEVIYEATKCYVEEKKEQHIQEAMRQGYIEMAKINLNIASESFLAEQEAVITCERQVSGV
ncbi:antitoxin [Streptohalobacillus salinus]|nr:antitoxin [Streptohalobacillus salinus]